MFAVSVKSHQALTMADIFNVIFAVVRFCLQIIVLYRAIASLLLPGGQDKNISSIFPHFPVVILIFPQIFLIFFLILVFWVGEPPTREGPGYATGLGTYGQDYYTLFGQKAGSTLSNNWRAHFQMCLNLNPLRAEI